MLYEDDTCVIEPRRRDLQSLLDIYSKYGFEKYIFYNPSKPQRVVVTPSAGRHLKYPNVYITNNKMYNV